jgi:hypothetical protein
MKFSIIISVICYALSFLKRKRTTQKDTEYFCRASIHIYNYLEFQPIENTEKKVLTSVIINYSEPVNDFVKVYLLGDPKQFEKLDGLVKYTEIDRTNQAEIKENFQGAPLSHIIATKDSEKSKLIELSFLVWDCNYNIVTLCNIKEEGDIVSMIRIVPTHPKTCSEENKDETFFKRLSALRNEHVKTLIDKAVNSINNEIEFDSLMKQIYFHFTLNTRESLTDLKKLFLDYLLLPEPILVEVLRGININDIDNDEIAVVKSKINFIEYKEQILKLISLAKENKHYFKANKEKIIADILEKELNEIDSKNKQIWNFSEDVSKETQLKQNLILLIFKIKLLKDCIESLQLNKRETAGMVQKVLNNLVLDHSHLTNIRHVFLTDFIVKGLYILRYRVFSEEKIKAYQKEMLITKLGLNKDGKHLFKLIKE